MRAGDLPVVASLSDPRSIGAEDAILEAEATAFLYHTQQLALRLPMTLSLEDVVQEVIRRVEAGLKARAIAVTTTESGRLGVMGSSNCSQSFLRHLQESVPRIGMPEERSMAEKRQIFVHPKDPEAQERVEPAAAPVTEEHAWVVSPLRAGPRVFGTLSVGFMADGRRFAAEQAALSA